MRELINKLGTRSSGFTLMAIAAGLAACGAGLVMTSIWRWEAIDSLDTYHLSLFARAGKDALEAAREAAQDMPHEATAVLPSLDLSHDEAVQTMTRLVPRAGPGQRRLLEVADGLAQVLHDKAPADIPGDDGILLSYLAALPKTGPSAAPALGNGSPPQRGILALALQRRFAAAWAAGDAESVRAACGPLLLLDPRQPDAGRLRILLSVSDTATSSDRLRAVFQEGLPDAAARVAFIRQACVLWPHRLPDLVALIPPEQLTVEERQSSLTSISGKLDDQVRNAVSHPDQDIIDMLLPRAIAMGRVDLARQLFNLLHADRKAPHELALATLEGDLPTMLKLSGDHPELIPRISTPVIANGRMSFHLASPSGFIPHTRIDVRIDGKPLSDDKVLHWASLVTVDIGPSSGRPYEVRLGDRIVASGKLPP